MKEMTELLGQSNVTLLRKSLLNLTVGGESVIMLNVNRCGSLITVNPRVYYKGVNIEELSYLVGIFSVLDNNRQ